MDKDIKKEKNCFSYFLYYHAFVAWKCEKKNIHFFIPKLKHIETREASQLNQSRKLMLIFFEDFFLLILEDFLNDDLISLDEYGSSLEYIIKQDHTRAHLMIHDLFNHFFCLLLSAALFFSSDLLSIMVATFYFKQFILLKFSFKLQKNVFYWYL